jgi:hypothetical protein
MKFQAREREAFFLPYGELNRSRLLKRVIQKRFSIRCVSIFSKANFTKAKPLGSMQKNGALEFRAR